MNLPRVAANKVPADQSTDRLITDLCGQWLPEQKGKIPQCGWNFNLDTRGFLNYLLCVFKSFTSFIVWSLWVVSDRMLMTHLAQHVAALRSGEDEKQCAPYWIARRLFIRFAETLFSNLFRYLWMLSIKASKPLIFPRVSNERLE